MLLVDRQIRRLSTQPEFFADGRPLLHPFSEAVSDNGVISYGLTSAGYDMRLDNKIMVFRNTRNDPVGPKRFRDAAYAARMFDTYVSDNGLFLVPSHSYVLVQSLEYIAMPRHLKGRCVGKSTYARCGIIVNTTPLEPEWHGHLTIEIANTNPCPVELHVLEGIAQLEFEVLSELPEITYKDKGGKYQGQTDVTPARVKDAVEVL